MGVGRKEETAAALVAAIADLARRSGMNPMEISRRDWKRLSPDGAPSDYGSRALGGWTATKVAASRLLAKDPHHVDDATDGHPSIFDDETDDATDVDVKTVARYVVTYAQNATPLHDDFFASLTAYCEHRKAELVVVPGRYRNPTSIWSASAENDEWWDERISPFLVPGRRKLADDLAVFGDISIQPTAARPLTGFEVMAGRWSSIFGHPKVQLSTIAGSASRGPRLFMTTGAVTVENYTPSKAGAKAREHHILGAVVVEVALDGQWFVRHINATTDGEFDDLCEHFGPYGAEPASRPLALVMGDIHCPRVDEPTIAATLEGPSSIVAKLNPELIVLHDVLDFRARNHHDRKDPDAAFARFVEGTDDVESEVNAAVEFIDSMPTGVDVAVIASNHDEALDRWLREANPASDPANARFFHWLRSAKLEAFEGDGEWTPALEIAYRDRGMVRARFVSRNESLDVGGIECGFHGDKGLNGSRGSLTGYAKLGDKMVIGHSHTPAIMDGVHQVGMSGRLDQGYNDQPSSWAHAHCLIYANGKRTLLFVTDGRWRADADADADDGNELQYDPDDVAFPPGFVAEVTHES